MKVKVKFLRYLNKPDEIFDNVIELNIDFNGISLVYGVCNDALDCGFDVPNRCTFRDVRYLHIEDGEKHYIIQVT